ncbi:hypothetical protein V9T40_005436 [Parthenolecanium corni]|uniref:Uncharacterized protein n=1 Tax=Parthenolecanium corni TaxID=536013 RepID=A0AAN9TET5_9HEMI
MTSHRRYLKLMFGFVPRADLIDSVIRLSTIKLAGKKGYKELQKINKHPTLLSTGFQDSTLQHVDLFVD